MTFTLTNDHARWASSARRRYGRPPEYWHELIEEQNGCCKLSGAKLLFDSQSGTPVTGGEGCHPLYAAADHIDPGKSDSEIQLVCYDLNDLKGHMPRPLFDALCRTKEWQDFIRCWKSIADQSSEDRSAFKELISRGLPLEQCR